MPSALALALHGRPLRFPWLRRFLAPHPMQSKGPGDNFPTTIPLDDPGEAGLNPRELHYYRWLKKLSTTPSRPQ